LIVFIGIVGESGELGKAGEESVGGIGLAVGRDREDKRVGRGKWRDDAVAAHFPQGDLDDLGDRVAVEDGGNGVADIDLQTAAGYGAVMIHNLKANGFP
jgi:hypothetical protein